MRKNILKKTLKVFQIIRTSGVPVVLSPEAESTELAQLPEQNSAFLNLPIDIFNLFIKYLAYQDLVALSLTTKGLRHVCPDSSSKKSPRPDCISLIYKRLLPPKSPRIKAYPSYWGQCSYCSRDLCPPSCPSALFLDYRTGVFYPASLYPTHEAVSARTDEFSETSACKEHFVPGDAPILWSNSPSANFDRPMYKTIWCEHHRCPSSLLLDNYNKEDAPIGAYRFYGDYYSNGDWAMVRDGPPPTNRDPAFAIPHTRYLVGYRKKTSDQDDETVAKQSANADSKAESLENVIKFYKLHLNNGLETIFYPYRDQNPVDERYFYDTLCRHCFLPLRRSDTLRTFWSRRTCTCSPPSKSRLAPPSHNPILAKSGCQGCGVVSVKFTTVEAFAPVPAYDSQIHFSLVVASEVEIGMKRVEGRFVKRLVPLHPEKVQQALELIRYEPITPVPPKPSPSLQDLPLPIINKILFYALCNTRYSEPRFIREGRLLIFRGQGEWRWGNYYSEPTGMCSQCRRFRNLDRDTRIRSTWRCTEGCNYGFHMFMTKGGARIY